jgi:uncharacterized membrane protein YoaT (DUF817 family)
MYASVGSYIARIWRIFDIRFSHYPPAWVPMLLAAGIYVNFFTHHWIADMRVPLLAATAIIFWRCRIWFRPFRHDRAMPVLVGFFLVASFIWLGENIGTLSHAWIYPNQRHGWALVSPTKLVAWYLLMIISFALVAMVNKPRAMSAPEGQAGQRAANGAPADA